MKNALYLECYSGISGDMTVAALLDLGANETILLDGLKSLCIDGYTIEISRIKKNGIDVCDFHVILKPTEPIEMLHTNHHSHSPKEHHHEHRNLNDIVTIIEQSSITSNAKKLATEIFSIVAESEAKAHGLPIKQVHFHEIGAVDSIIDIVATAICIDNLAITDVIISELYEGTGTISCQHGTLPIPVPAVVNIASAYHLPLHITSTKGELVTPTGIAIAAAIRTASILPLQFTIKKIGLGAGKRNYEGANILRAMLIEAMPSTMQNKKEHMQGDNIWLLECNLDDCSGEALSFTMEQLLQQGAFDVYYTPIYMKKNRPAYLLSVICHKENLFLMEDIIFTNTTTIGLRKQEIERTILDREIKTVSTIYGDAIVKVCYYRNKTYYYPEYESVKKLCIISKKSYAELYQLIQHNSSFINTIK